MALPNSVDNATPAGSDAPSTLDNQIRDLKTAIEDLLGIPNATAISAAGLNFVAAGMDRIVLQNAAADPIATGRVQRNATDLLMHDGTAARRFFHTNNAIVTANIGPHSIGGATNTRYGLLQLGAFTGVGATQNAAFANTVALSNASGVPMYGYYLAPTFTNVAGTTADVSWLQIEPSLLTITAGAVTNASGLKITAAPSGAAGTNRALWVAGGLSQFDARVMIGGGSFVAGANGQGSLYGDAVGGLTLYGQGSTDDLTLVNKVGQGVLSIPTGGRNLEVNPNAILLVGTAVTTGAVAGGMRTLESILVGGGAVRATTAGTNRLDIYDGTAPVGTLAAGISLYSTAGELRVMDSGGVATLLSPHDNQGYWVFDSLDSTTGRRLHVDMERLIKALNAHFGWNFVKETMEC